MNDKKKCLCTRGMFISLRWWLQQEIEVSQSFVKFSLPFFSFCFIFHLLPLCTELHLLFVSSHRGDTYNTQTVITESSHFLLEPRVILSQGAVSAIRLDWDDPLNDSQGQAWQKRPFARQTY